MDASSDGTSFAGWPSTDSGAGGGNLDAGNEGSATGGAGGSAGSSAGGSGPCTTRISYGDTWIHPASHPDAFDDVAGSVSWDGACTDDGQNSTATLSNGWKPYFSGHSACVMALDTTCPGAPACTTRISYGKNWLPAPNHPAHYDDVPGRVYWDRACVTQGATSYATLSNGWAPHFNGTCAMSFRYEGCGGLYQNPVVPGGCADPGVIRDGKQYIVACTSGNAANAFPLRTSPDLVHWKSAGAIFPAASKPSWAASDFWAPEIHKVGSHYVAYFTARHKDGQLSVGAATASSPLGPFTDIGQPLVHDAAMGMIDPSEFADSSGRPYVVWKADGNAVGKPTPIYGQQLSASGTALKGSRVQLIVNDRSWEGSVVEGPWVVAHGGSYYLLYSGNAYYNATYAVGVARSSSPLGPYQKAGAPILTTGGKWVGPGHCSVVDTPGGNTVMVYHAWQSGQVNGPGDQRHLLVDAMGWSGGWPSVPEAPSQHSRPMP
jgi:GH43 family beta-xylosidase